MKVYLIKASAKGEYKKYKKSMGGPPQNIFAAAAATPRDIDVEMCDETIDMRVNFASDANLVVIFMSTPDAIRAYEIGETFKTKGKQVIYGGLHVSFLPEEAKKHGDSVLIGECEGVWKQLLTDAEKHTLKPFYKAESPFEIKNLKPYPTDIIPLKKYEGIWSVMVSRGCVYRCGFCTVPGFFDKGQAYRPIPDIVEEIKGSGAKWIELHADNLLVNRKYAVDLFNALIPLNIQWIGETSINLAKDEALLALAAKSGLKYVLIGLETPSVEALGDVGKTFVKPAEVKAKIERFNKLGIEVDSSFIFGFDEHGPDIFKRTAEYCRDIGLQSIHSVLLIPFPGTTVFKDLKNENRILTTDWSKYDGVHVTFQPKSMSVKELERGAYWFHHESRKIEKQNKLASNAQNNYADTGSAIGSWLNGLEPYKWKTWLAIFALVGATLMNWVVIWSLFFIYWSVLSIKNKELFFVEPVRRDDNPVVYWVTIVVWLLMSLMVIWESFSAWVAG